MFINPSTQRDLLPNLRRRRGVEHNLRQIRLDRDYSSSLRSRSNVDHQNFVLR